MTEQHAGPGPRVLIAFVLLSLIWGSSYLFIRIGVEHLSPAALVTGRLLVGLLVLIGLVAVRRQPVGLPLHTLLVLAAIAAVNTTVP
jgi:drug/metabolite transporter (DMT)-like permease